MTLSLDNVLDKIAVDPFHCVIFDHRKLTHSAFYFIQSRSDVTHAKGSFSGTFDILPRVSEKSASVKSGKYAFEFLRKRKNSATFAKCEKYGFTWNRGDNNMVMWREKK